MRKIALPILGTMLGLIVASTSAQAQATRTWVSGVGDDANPCSRTAPCKTFAGAISKTAAGGIINCLDPGGFGAVTITKSLTIDCTGTFAGSLASGTNGVNVAGAGIVVVLRGFSIEGVGTGLIGVNITNAAVVQLENMHIYGFRSGTAAGVRVATTGAVELSISNSLIADNGSGTATGGGIVVAPTGAAGSAGVSLNRVSVRNNSVGINADGTAASSAAGIKVIVSDSEVTGSTGNGIRAVSSAAGAGTQITINETVVTGNAGIGLTAEGNAKASVLTGASVITHNVTGISGTGGGQLLTYGNNQLNNNGTNGTFTAAAINLQ